VGCGPLDGWKLGRGTPLTRPLNLLPLNVEAVVVTGELLAPPQPAVDEIDDKVVRIATHSSALFFPCIESSGRGNDG
jgi:hypothetical protein